MSTVGVNVCSCYNILMEGKSPFERIVGGTEEEKVQTLSALQDVYQSKNQRLAEHELEKSPEELECIKKTERIVDGIVEYYGGVPKEVPLDHVYVLGPGSLHEITDGKISGGIHYTMSSKIGIERGQSKLLFASSVAHEMFHLKSPKSVRLKTSDDDVHLYRSGLVMVDTKDAEERSGEEKEYFGELEEAVVAECTKRFLVEISKDDAFRDEVEAVQKIRDWLFSYARVNGAPAEQLTRIDEELKSVANPQEMVARVLAYSDKEEVRQVFAAGMFNRLNSEGRVEMLERYRERKKMYDLLDMLVERSMGRFTEREEVFELFARANFTGNYLPLARVVESILGKGSFRKLAEEFKEESAYKKDASVEDDPVS